TMILGDLGADVIKIERPGSGDESRGWGPPFDSRGESAYYLCCNRNKMSVAADLDEAHDQALLRRLIGGANVVVDNFLSGNAGETTARWLRPWRARSGSRPSTIRVSPRTPAASRTADARRARHAGARARLGCVRAGVNDSR